MLLPVLLHKLNNVTQVIASVNSLARLAAESAPIARCAADLDSAGGMLARLGWLVGALARGSGSALGSARHEEHALEWLVELLAEALRREGRELAPAAGTLPRLDPRTSGESSWAIANWLLACARNARDATPLAWSLRGDGARLLLRTSRGPADAAGLVRPAWLDCEVRA